MSNEFLFLSKFANCNLETSDMLWLVSDQVQVKSTEKEEGKTDLVKVSLYINSFRRVSLQG